jgi:hypothetical protein
MGKRYMYMYMRNFEACFYAASNWLQQTTHEQENEAFAHIP